MPSSNYPLAGGFAARLSGLALGLALAVRPAGLVEAPGSTARRRRVPRSGMRSTVEVGGASPDNARRSAPTAVTFSGDGATGVRLTAWSSRTGAVPGDTAGTAGGRSPGPPGAAARRAVGLPPEGRDESCRTAYGAPPGPDPGRPRRRTLALVSPAISRVRFSCSTSRPSGPARRRCALEAVEKVVTAGACHRGYARRGHRS